MGQWPYWHEAIGELSLGSQGRWWHACGRIRQAEIHCYGVEGSMQSMPAARPEVAS